MNIPKPSFLGVGEEDPALWEYAQSGKYKEDSAFANMTPQQFYAYVLAQRGVTVKQDQGLKEAEKVAYQQAASAGFPSPAEYRAAIAAAIREGNGGGSGAPKWLLPAAGAAAAVYFMTR